MRPIGSILVQRPFAAIPDSVQNRSQKSCDHPKQAPRGLLCSTASETPLVGYTGIGGAAISVNRACHKRAQLYFVMCWNACTDFGEHRIGLCLPQHGLLSTQDFGMRGFPLTGHINQQFFVQFSPGRIPVIWISISPSGFSASRTVRPDNSITLRAMFRIFCGLPISSTKTSPPSA
jgi:hypothetical protein